MTLRIQVGIAIALIGMAMQIACVENYASTNYTRGEIRRMVREAHTGDQYRELAAYFRARQQDFHQSAREEHAEWARRAMVMNFGLAAKYPGPVDSSRYRYEYFTAESAEMSHKASYYEGMASKADRSGKNEGRWYVLSVKASSKIL